MEIFTIHDLINATFLGIKSYIEINSVIAAAILDTAFKPFSDLSMANLLAALGAGVILWRKKSWFFSSLLQAFQLK